MSAPTRLQNGGYQVRSAGTTDKIPEQGISSPPLFLAGVDEPRDKGNASFLQPDVYVYLSASDGGIQDGPVI